MTRISLQRFRKDKGLLDDDAFDEFLEELDGAAPALCEEGCEVEEDGTCPHGNVSVLVAMGRI